MLDALKTAILAVSVILADLVPQPAYTEGVVGQPLELNPFVKSVNEIDETIESLIFSPLPQLSRSFEVSEDGKEYIFNLKDGLTFTNGQALTADDVLYTLNLLPEFRDVMTEKLDRLTIKFTLKEPSAPFLGRLEVGVVPKGTPKESFGLTPIGSGPYKVTQVKKSNRVDELTIEAVDSGYKIKRVAFKFYQTHRDLTEAIKLGEVLGYGGPEILEWPSFNYFQAPLLGRYYGLFFNLSGKEILKDREFRQNLAKALDKKVLIREALNGEGTSVSGPLEGSFAESQEISTYDYKENPSVSYNSQLTLTVPATLIHLKTADIIKEYWSRIGVAVDIKPVPPSEILDKVIKPKDFEVLLFGQEVGSDPDRYVYWHSSQEKYPGLNFTSYEQMRVNKALEEGRKTLDTEKRKEHYANFQRVLTADVPVIYLYQPLYTFGISKKILNASLPPLFHPKDRFLNLKDWRFE